MRTFSSIIVVLMLVCVACEEDVLTFPTPNPAQVRIVNTTQDVGVLSVLIDRTSTVDVNRGTASNEVTTSAGRPVSFVLKEGTTDLRRDTLYYTLGGDARVILFTYGSKNGLVEFRRAIQDTTLDAASDPVIRFTHMAESTDQFSTLEVWITGGPRLLSEDFDYGLSSTSYQSIAPGTYSFEVREYGTTNVGATISNVTLERGKSYMLYVYDTEPPTPDRIALSIF